MGTLSRAYLRLDLKSQSNDLSHEDMVFLIVMDEKLALGVKQPKWVQEQATTPNNILLTVNWVADGVLLVEKSYLKVKRRLRLSSK